MKDDYFNIFALFHRISFKNTYKKHDDTSNRMVSGEKVSYAEHNLKLLEGSIS